MERMGQLGELELELDSARQGSRLEGDTYKSNDCSMMMCASASLGEDIQAVCILGFDEATGSLGSKASERGRRLSCTSFPRTPLKSQRKLRLGLSRFCGTRPSPKALLSKQANERTSRTAVRCCESGGLHLCTSPAVRPGCSTDMRLEY